MKNEWIINKKGEENDIMRKEILKFGRFFKSSNPDFYNGLRSSDKLMYSNTNTKIRVEASKIIYQPEMYFR